MDLLVWSAAEHAVTLICICIPVCRPLYKDILREYGSRISSSGNQRIKLDNIESAPEDREQSNTEAGVELERASNLGSKKARTTSNSYVSITYNQSDEEILLQAESGNTPPASQSNNGTGIRVTQEFHTVSEEGPAPKTQWLP